MFLKKNGTQQHTVLDSCHGEINTYTCGTAMQRTVYIKVNCEMSLEGARIFAQQILENCFNLEQTKKGCNQCEHSPGCPEKEDGHV